MAVIGVRLFVKVAGFYKIAAALVMSLRPGQRTAWLRL
jgi:hypothetical protein